jgi:3-phenylpropionate/trans-cinnamate dioxygenase ferredoxin reductase subunit
MKRDHRRPWVILGGGLAAAEAAKTLRAERYDGRLVVVSDERHPPYERPPLTKEYLRGEKPLEKLYAGDPALWTSPVTDLVLGRRAVSVDAHDRRVHLDDGSRLGFDPLLIATGASAVTGLPGADAEFVHAIRTIDDADRLRQAAAASSSVAVVGGGWIGAEAAASLRQMGLDVTLVIPGSEVLEQRLGAVVGRRYTALHERNGIRVIRDSRATSIVDGRSGRGVHLRGGAVVHGDLVVLGLGARPNVDLATSAGLAVEGGVVADHYLETVAPGIYVAGDVAAPWHPRYGRHLRLEHWDTARRQGRVAAANFLGRRVSYDRVPYFYSDQFDLGMESWGLTSQGEVVVREVGQEGGFVAVWLDEGRVIGALQANAWDLSKEIRRLVEDARMIDASRFLDPDLPLAEVALPTAA